MQDKIEYQINFGEAKAMTFLSLAGIQESILKIFEEHRWHLTNSVSYNIKDIGVVI